MRASARPARLDSGAPSRASAGGAGDGRDSARAPFRPLLRLWLEWTDQGLVILLHGHFSTDVGVFDGFLRLCRNRPARQPWARIFSWPHDTLATIDEHARDLSLLIQRLLRDRWLPVVLVGHGRGGLVARRTASELARLSERLRLAVRGCVTFGTPHEIGPVDAPSTMLRTCRARGSFTARPRGPFSL